MTILDLKDQIVKNQLSNFYIFTGTEIGIMNIYLEQMSNKLSLPITRADSVLSVYERCMGGNMFGNETGFYIIRNDNDFPKQEKAYETIQKDIGKNVIVLLYEKIDSRLKFGKFFKEQTIVFEKLAPNVLKSYIKKSIELSDKNIDTLIELCNGSYDMCMLEIDKIKQFTEGYAKDKKEKLPYDGAFLRLLGCGVIYQPEESDVFKFTEAVCSKNIKLAFHLEQTLRDNGSSSINLLGTLYNSIKSTMLIQCCKDGNISEVTGLDKGQIYFNRKYVGKYKTEELVSAAKLIIKTVDDIKSGRIDDIYATKYVLSMIM